MGTQTNTERIPCEDSHAKTAGEILLKRQSCKPRNPLHKGSRDKTHLSLSKY
jgi:hypothetical protein